MKKFLKILLYIVLFLVFLFALVYFGSSPALTKIINDKIADKKIAGIYNISFNKAYINIFQMGITITDLELIPDSSAESRELYKYKKNLAHVKIKRLNASQIDIKKYLDEKKIVIHKITIRKPVIELYKNNHFTKALKREVKNDSASLLKDAHLKSISINNMELYYFIDTDKKADLIIDNLDLKLINPTFDLSKIDEPLEAIAVDDIELDIKKIAFIDNKKLYDIRLQSIDYQYDKNIFILKNFSIKPKYNKEEFAKRHKYQSDRFDISLNKLKLKGLDFQRLLYDKTIAIEQINISGLDMEVYRDKNYPFNLNKFPQLPQEAIRNLKQKIEINYISIKSSNIVYLEKAVGAKKTGKVEFQKVEADIHDFGNTWKFRKNKSLKIEASTSIYGKGKLNILLNFPLKSNTFYLTGILEETPMTAFNAITIPNAGIKIRSGEIQKMTFKDTLNTTHSTGTLRFHYSGLDISILKKQKKSGLRKDSKLLNFAANSVMPKGNPNKKGKFYEAKISFDRDKNKSVFGYLWKSIFSGVKDTFMKKNKKKKSKKKKRKKR